MFSNSAIMQMGKQYLCGNWPYTRKIRLARFIRKVIVRGILVRGVREIYEEGVRILREMEGKEEGKEEEEEDRGRNAFMFELYLMKLGGIQKKLGEDEVAVLRKAALEEKKRADEEKRKREIVEGEKREMEEKLRLFEMEEEKKRKEEEKRRREEEEKRSLPITSLDRTSVIFPLTDNIKREGNIIIHHGADSHRNCFIGGVMTSV